MARYQAQDPVYRRAKRSGYRSRAALKLEEIDRRYRLLRKGQAVVDLGCWPGGWTQVASRRVGPAGRVVAVDTRTVEPLEAVNVTVLSGDASSPELQARMAELLGGPADLVLSDMAPQLSGIGAADRARHEALVETALAVAAAALAEGGNLVVKLFSDSEAWFRKSATGYNRTVTFRPASTRKGSSEIYGLALSRVGGGD